MAETITLVQGDTLPVIELAMGIRGIDGNPDRLYDVSSDSVGVDMLFVDPGTLRTLHTVEGIKQVDAQSNKVWVSMAGVLEVPVGEYQVWALIKTDEGSQRVSPPQRIRVIEGPTE